jgi:hypothetical protein
MKIKYQDVNDPQTLEDKCSIDFEPKNIAELDSFHLFLAQEAILRNRNMCSWSS